jgi:hypothetical protein
MSGARATESGIALPPREAIRFLLGKTNTPSQRWSDVWQEAHARSFMVAGAATDALLNDFRAAVAKALEQGTTLAEFRRDFDAIVARNGWAHTGTPGWRATIIYETNLSMAYAAGRHAQMTEPTTLAIYPYWQYVHSGAENPRLQHLAWNGLVLRADDGFWATHYPPNGWRCGCRVRPLSARDLARQGRSGPDQAPPVEMRPWTRPSDGAQLMVPQGIDPGFAYNVGEAWAQARPVIPGNARLTPPPGFPPPPPAGAAPTPGGTVPAPIAAPARRTAPPAPAGVDDGLVVLRPEVPEPSLPLPLPPPLAEPPITAESFARWLPAALRRAREARPVVLGVTAPELRERAGIAAPAIVLTPPNLRRIAGKDARTGRNIGLGPEDLARLPALMQAPIAVLRQRDNGNLVYVFRPRDPNERRLGKLVVLADQVVSMPRPGGGRQSFAAGLLRSAGLTDRANLMDRNVYELLSGGM